MAAFSNHHDSFKMDHPSFISRVALLSRLALQMSRANRQDGRYQAAVLKKAGDVISAATALDDGSLPPLLFKKIQWYMTELLITGSLLSGLRLKKLSQGEERQFIYLGAIMALFDAMVDDQLPSTVPAQSLNHFINKDYHTGGLSSIEKIFLLYSERFTENVDSSTWIELERHFEKIRYQLESKSQAVGEPGEEELMRLTIGKGAASLLLCYALLFPADEKNERAMFELGALIQLMNDAQDVYKDASRGITTFMAFRTNWKDAETVLEKHMAGTCKAFLESAFPRKRLYPFLFQINAMLVLIRYKLEYYSGITNNILDIKSVSAMSREDFRVRLFSFKALVYSIPRILAFKPAK